MRHIHLCGILSLSTIAACESFSAFSDSTEEGIQKCTEAANERQPPPNAEVIESVYSDAVDSFNNACHRAVKLGQTRYFTHSRGLYELIRMGGLPFDIVNPTLMKHKTVLDVGTGYGLFPLELLHDFHINAFGFDASLQPVLASSQLYCRRFFEANVTQDNVTLFFAENFADIITANYTFFSYEPMMLRRTGDQARIAEIKKGLRNVSRLLKPKGEFWITGLESTIDVDLLVKLASGSGLAEISRGSRTGNQQNLASSIQKGLNNESEEELAFRMIAYFKKMHGLKNSAKVDPAMLDAFVQQAIRDYKGSTDSYHLILTRQ